MWTRIAIGCVALLALCGQSPPAEAPGAFESVTFKVDGALAATLDGRLRRPAGPGPFPAVVALHGCGGLLNAKGRIAARETDWAERLVAQGYAVLLPDSFNPRGYRQICNLKAADRPIRPRDRAKDAAAAIAWLEKQPFVDAKRIALMGWSHGGSSVLWTVAKDGPIDAARFKVAVAFYPGCRVPAQSRTWAPRTPLTVLIGDADDWTPPEPCRMLKSNHPGIALVEYPGAVHGFDAPNAPLRTRTGVGLSARGDGRVKVGTDPKARAAAIIAVDRILREAFAKR